MWCCKLSLWRMAKTNNQVTIKVFRKYEIRSHIQLRPVSTDMRLFLFNIEKKHEHPGSIRHALPPPLKMKWYLIYYGARSLHQPVAQCRWVANGGGHIFCIHGESEIMDNTIQVNLIDVRFLCIHTQLLWNEHAKKLHMMSKMEVHH